jgi:hypothetical protein
MVLPELEDIARLKKYAIDYNIVVRRTGAPNIAGAINEIISRELRRRYPDLTAAQYKWCMEEQAKNEHARKLTRKSKGGK